MMQDPIFYVTMAMTSLTGIMVIALAALKGWNGWLDLKKAELGQHVPESSPPSAAARIEVADLKERIRKLEAIAAGVDL
jgi:hypothetical protein